MLVNSFELVNTWEVAAPAAISSVPASVARGQANVAIGITDASALQGGATVTFGGQPCTITTYPGTSGNLIVTIPAGINLLYAAATHTFVYTDDNTSTSESAAVAFTPAAGRSYINLVDPAYADDGYILFGYEGTPAPVTGDQLEYPDVTAPTGIGFSVSATSEWVMDSNPVVNQTVDCQIIRAATGVRSATWTATYDAISESIILSVPLGEIGIEGLVPIVTVGTGTVLNIPLGTIGVIGLVPTAFAEDNSVSISLTVPMSTISVEGLVPDITVSKNSLIFSTGVTMVTEITLTSEKRQKVYRGQSIRFQFTIVDENGTVVDLSTGSEISAILKRIGGDRQTIEVNILNAGNDGVVYSDVTSDMLNESGVWLIQLTVSKNNAEYLTNSIEFEVASRV